VVRGPVRTQLWVLDAVSENDVLDKTGSGSGLNQLAPSSSYGTRGYPRSESRGSCDFFYSASRTEHSFITGVRAHRFGYADQLRIPLVKGKLSELSKGYGQASMQTC
jgi:hypothetical protein